MAEVKATAQNLARAKGQSKSICNRMGSGEKNTRIMSSTDMEVTIHPTPDTRMADHVVACTQDRAINFAHTSGSALALVALPPPTSSLTHTPASKCPTFPRSLLLNLPSFVPLSLFCVTSSLSPSLILIVFFLSPPCLCCHLDHTSRISPLS